MKDWERNNQSERNGYNSINEEKKRAEQLAEERRKWMAGEKYIYDAPKKQGNFTSADKERPIVSSERKSESYSARRGQSNSKKRNTSRNAKTDFRSNDERRRAYAKKARKKRKRNVIKALLFTVIIAAAILVSLSLTVLFKIESITVSGDIMYTDEQIIESSGVELGDNLWRTTSKNVTAELSTSLPYVGSVKVKRTIPSTIELEVTQAVPTYSIEKSKKYILLDENNKVLEEKAEKKGDTIQIKGIDLLNTKPGTVLTVKSPESLNAAKDIVSKAEANGIKLTEVDVSDINLLSAVYNGKIRLDFGSESDMDEKLKMAKEIITKLEDENSKQEGTINLKSVTKAFFKNEEINTTAATTKKNKKKSSKSDTTKEN